MKLSQVLGDDLEVPPQVVQPHGGAVKKAQICGPRKVYLLILDKKLSRRDKNKAEISAKHE